MGFAELPEHIRRKLAKPSNFIRVCPINNERTGDVSLCVPTTGQLTVLDALEDHNRVLVQKYRQSYTTTAGAMWLYGRTMQNPGYHGFLVADQKDTAEETFNYIREANSRQPPLLKVAASLGGTRHLWFTNGSQLKILYATTAHLGIGRFADSLVLTEFGLWPNAETAMQRLSPAYRKRPHSKVLIESTPGPKGCLMESMCLAAMEGKGDWLHKFLDWTKDPTVTIPPPAGFKPDNNELTYISAHPGITLGHIYFRRMLLEGEMKGDARLFDNQYPPDPYSGFTVAGVASIPLDAVAEQLKCATLPPKTGDVWEVVPRTEAMRVLVCADPNGYGAAGDPSGLTVWDLVSRCLLAYWTGREDPGVFADRIIRVQRDYAAEIVAIESNNNACVQSCRDKGCPNLYHTSREHPGYYQSHMRKSAAISQAVDMLRGGWGIGALEVLHQLYTYAPDKRGKDHHFDLAITVFMAADFMCSATYLPRAAAPEIHSLPTRANIKKFLRQDAR